MTPHSKPSSHLDIWAGIECTVNRVGDEFHDQCKQSGHIERSGDLELIRNLGLRVIRYPFLWETADWEFFDRQISEMKRLGISPVAGLLHHGSGPMSTSLLDPNFPDLFADYAAKFASRYPDIIDYTPINEPLTTARFSGLYGVWYPHCKSDHTFLRALIHQTKATILAMKAIRRINPKARLIQTEDLGKTSGTEDLQYQVDFENHRRWLSIDLLCGRIGPQHALYPYFLANGVTVEELEWFKAHATPPDLFGINHYLLSNRFIDSELRHYPVHLHGGNGIDSYVDVGAVDSARAKAIAPSEIFIEAWERYNIPIVITEVHASGGRESQLRWFHSILQESRRAIECGADLRAITAWSVFGSYDWNSLCTKKSGYYESGVFDLRSGSPVPTAIAFYIRDYLATREPVVHPVLEQKGWWVRMSGPISERGIRIYSNQSKLSEALRDVCVQRGIKLLNEFDPNAWGIIDLEQDVDYRSTQVRQRNAAAAGIHYLKIVSEFELELSESDTKAAAHHILDLLIDFSSGNVNVDAHGKVGRSFPSFSNKNSLWGPVGRKNKLFRSRLNEENQSVKC